MAEQTEFERLRTAAFKSILIRGLKLFPSRVEEVFRRLGWTSFRDFMAEVDRRGRILLPYQKPLAKTIEDRGVHAAIDEARAEANTQAMVNVVAEEFLGPPPGVEPDFQAVREAFEPMAIRSWRDLAVSVLDIALEVQAERTGKAGLELATQVATRLFARQELDEHAIGEITRAFGIAKPEDLEALLAAFWGGELTIEDLDRAVGHPEILTELVNMAPSNPHKGIVFGRPQVPPGVKEWRPEIGAKRRPDPVRPVTLRLVQAIAFDVFPDSPAVLADFWITDPRHYEALYYPVRAGEITPAQLDEVLGNPEAITALVRSAPSNPHKDIVFGEGGA